MNSNLISGLKLREGISKKILAPKFLKNEISKNTIQTGIWKSEILEYEGFGKYLIIRFPNELENAIANFSPIGDEALKVMIQTHFLNVMGKEMYAFIEAWDAIKYLNGIGREHWTRKFQFRIDMWIRLKT